MQEAVLLLSWTNDSTILYSIIYTLHVFSIPVSTDGFSFDILDQPWIPSTALIHTCPREAIN